MPYVAFYTMKGLERTIAQNGCTVLDQENLFPAPPNLFVAAKKEYIPASRRQFPGGRLFILKL